MAGTTQRVGNGAYVFDGRRRLLLLEKYNSEDHMLLDRYKGTVNVLFYKFRDDPPMMNDDICQSTGCTLLACLLVS